MLTSSSLRTPNKQAFCRNEYNVSGYCSKQHCPLANSQYATVRSDASTGRIYLYMKTVERAHLPSRWWERIRLPSNYNKALDMIDERLVYWPKYNNETRHQLTFSDDVDSPLVITSDTYRVDGFNKLTELSLRFPL